MAFMIAYVIMPGHVQAGIAVTNTGKCINIIVSNGKRFVPMMLIVAYNNEKVV